MDARRRKSIKKTSLRQEKQAAEDVGGRTTANSGAARFSGGADVRVPGTLRIECKFTESDCYTLKLKELEKLRKQSNKTLEIPIFQFAFSFRGKLSKFAVVPWGFDDTPRADYYEHPTDKGSVILRQDLLTQLLNQGKYMVLFTKERRKFEIQHWDDFMKQFIGPHVSMGWKMPQEVCGICEANKNPSCDHLRK